MKSNLANNKLLDYPTIFAAVPDLYVLLDRDLNIREVSDSYLDATMLKREEILNKNIFDAFPENPNETKSSGMENLRSSIDRVITTKKPDTMAVQKYYVRLPGSQGGKYEERYWSSATLPIFGSNNEVEYILLRVEDVTEFIRLRETERLQEQLKTRTQKMEKEIYQRAQEIQEANKQLRILNDKLANKEMDQKKLFDKLQQINQIKTQFFANISQDLRTPLTLILASINKLKKHINHEEESYDVELLERNAYELLRHVNDLLDISKLETKKIELYYSNCDLVKIVRHTAALFNSHAKSKNLDYQIITPATVPAELDVQKIQRILVHLLTNAFKYTPKFGRIECKLRAESKNAIIEVSDSGPGISLEMRDNLFNNFFHGRVEDQKKVTSFGLGLTIVKDFIELHGGKILVETSPLGGALFLIHLPLKAPASAKIEYKGSDPKDFPKELLPEIITKLDAPHAYVHPEFVKEKTNLPIVLIVQDNVDMTQYISSVLAEEYQIITAVNGSEGLKKALQYKPDLIIADLLLKNMNGEDMLHEIRQNNELNNVSIIFLTARMDEEVCPELLMGGAQDCLGKPFSPQELKARVTNLIQLKKVNDELKRKNLELIETNKELDSFGYSVSHDLRNPVQSILGFSTLLLDAFNLDEEVREYLQHMYYSGKRMEELINDLLELSRSLREEVNYENVNFSELVTNISKTLQKRDPSRKVKFIIKDNVTVLADEGLMKIVFENLLNNAWKYTSKSNEATIEFGVQEGNNPVFYIKDNGVGFPQSEANKLFIPFSRLHAEKDFPGTGIGLATVKRIIEKHKGKIWVESLPGAGTTFYFHLRS